MKKITDFIKKYWKWITVGICGLLMLTLFTCGNANYRENQRLLFQTELTNAVETLRDSMTEANAKQLIHFQDSIQKTEKAKTDVHKKRADQWESKANILYKQNQGLQKKVDGLLAQYGDSLDTNCKKVVNAYQEQVEGLKDEKDALNEEINELDLALTADSTGWDACKKETFALADMVESKVDLIIVKDRLITDLKVQLGKQNNWLNKNKGWIGLGTGIVLGILIVK